MGSGSGIGSGIRFTWEWELDLGVGLLSNSQRGVLALSFTEQTRCCAVTLPRNEWWQNDLVKKEMVHIRSKNKNSKGKDMVKKEGIREKGKIDKREGKRKGKGSVQK